MSLVGRIQLWPEVVIDKSLQGLLLNAKSPPASSGLAD